MNQRQQELFKEMAEHPRPELAQRIITRINVLQKRRQTMQFAFYGILSGGAVAALVPITLSIIHGVLDSGFGTYLSLFFSDSALVIANWQTFLLSLGETFPLTQVTLFLAVISLGIWGIHALVRTWKQSPISTALALS
jgi:hypothetical protein